LSVLPAVIACTIAIAIIGKAKIRSKHLFFGSLLFGAGIGTMHYTGMAAMRLNAIMVYDPMYFIISIVVAVILAFVSIKLKSITESFSNHRCYTLIKTGSILIMGAAVAGMHYTGMAAVYYFPSTTIDPALSISHNSALAKMVIVLAFLILMSTITITLFEQRIQLALRSAHASRKRMFDAIDNISDGFVLFDAADELILSNEHFRKMYKEIGEWIKPGVSYIELVEKRAKYASEHISSNAKNYIDSRLNWHKDPMGHFVEILNDGRHVFGKEQRAESGDIVGIWTDISELQQAKDRLNQSNKQIQMVLDASPSPIVIRAINDNELLYINESGKQYFAAHHYDMEVGNKETFFNLLNFEDLKKNILDGSNPKNKEYELTVKSGEKYTVVLSATLISYDIKPAVLLSFVDITGQKKLECQLRELSQTDPLTGIYNRRYLTEAGSQEIMRCHRNKHPLTLIMLDLDDFKSVNDKYGHEVGDLTIIKTTEICRNSIRGIDILGRIGGEEFVIILPDKNFEDAIIVAERIRINIETQTMNIDETQFNFTVSIGLSFIDLAGDQADSFQNILSRADQKLYQAKNNGRNQIAY
jgi:diguanylate cyclase (GGDEF)-like protein